jgi:AbrB family looped-hinge helix DNA binding protein
MTVSVKVSSRHQIYIPLAARKQLNIKSGDRLLVDIQDGLLILIPQPENYTERLAGLYRQIWQGIDTTAYLQEEREAWDLSTNG